MKSLENYIDRILQEPGCNMISPGSDYTRDEFGMVDKAIPLSSENMAKLENTVSECMKRLYAESILETLKKEPPILHIDCSQKEEDDIMFFIFRECMRYSKMEDKEAVVSKIIGRRTIVTNSREERQEYVDKNHLNVNQILDHYRKLLKARLHGIEPERTSYFFKCESDVTFDGLTKFMEHENTKYLYLYLDKVQTLSVYEQTRINRLLYSRGGIDHNNKRIRLKINNGSKGRKTRYADTGIRVDSPHDYSDTHIYAKDL